MSVIHGSPQENEVQCRQEEVLQERAYGCLNRRWTFAVLLFRVKGAGAVGVQGQSEELCKTLYDKQ